MLSFSVHRGELRRAEHFVPYEMAAFALNSKADNELTQFANVKLIFHLPTRGTIVTGSNFPEKCICACWLNRQRCRFHNQSPADIISSPLYPLYFPNCARFSSSKLRVSKLRVTRDASERGDEREKMKSVVN